MVFIGAEPCTGVVAGRRRPGLRWLRAAPGRTRAERGAGRSPTGRDPLLLETSLPGVFAAGDVRSGSVKRVASAVGEGAMAVRLVHEHLSSRTAT